MSLLQHVFGCNHTYETINFYKDVMEMERSQLPYDELPDIVEEVFSISTLDGARVSTEAYTFTFPRKITWNEDVIPLITTDRKYEVVVNRKETVSRQYSSRDCPMCNGNGWYTGIVTVDGRNDASPPLLYLGEKVLHALLTPKGSHSFDKTYGSNLVKMIGKSFYNKERLRETIINDVKSVEKYIIKSQARQQVDGRKISSHELLRAVEIKSIEFNDTLLEVKVTLVIYSMDGSPLTVRISPLFVGEDLPEGRSVF